jgi:colanic acid/amylovoran biosynthesis protein
VLVGGSAKAVVAIVTRGRLGARGIRAHYDTVVVAGGGYMYSAKRRFNMSLWHSLLSVRYGSAALQRVVMMPQSIGPITRRFDQKFVSWALSGVAVVVRETVSLAASRHRPQLPNVRVIDDVAFYPAVARRQRSTTSRPVLRLVAMDWTWSTSVAANRFDRYVEQMALLAELAANAGYFVVIGGHSMIREHDQDDVRVAQQIQQTARVNVEVDTDADVGHLYDEYVDAAVVVGTRLHSCIMALSVGTPAIGLSYQEKTVGVLAGVDHGAYVHSVDDFDPHEVFKQVQALAAMPREHWAELADRTKRSIFDQYEELAR